MKTIKESDIRPKYMVKKMNQLRNEDMKLFQPKSFLKINCPACDSKKYDFVFKKSKFNFVECKKCSTVFVNPRPSIKLLEKYYSSSKCMNYWSKIYEKTEKSRIKNIFVPRLNLVKQILSENKIKKINHLVEVGAGYGWFCRLAQKNNLAKSITAIEPSKLTSKKCRKIPNINVIESTIEKIPSLNADVIVNFELIEHLFNPRPFLKSCYDGLNKNGLLILTTPNYFGLDIQLLKHNHESVVAPNHLNFFNPESLSYLLKKIGFKKINVITPGILDVDIMIGKLKSGTIKDNEYPFFSYIKNQNNPFLIEDIQKLIQKYNLSSNMLVSAKKY